MTLPTTPSQTVGPFLHIGLSWEDGAHVVPLDTPGGFWLSGTLVDGAGAPVDDGLVETWQADADGRFAHPDDPRGDTGAATQPDSGFGRVATDAEGRWALFTIRPGSLPAGRGQTEAPHIDVSVLARGLGQRLVTRIYFADLAAANAADPVLATVDPARVATLLARPTDAGYTFDIVLQGAHETVFFDL